MASQFFALVREARGLTAARAQELMSSFTGWPRSFKELPSPVIYALSVAIEKAVSLIALPIMAFYLRPSEYGSYDVAVSVVELVNIVMSLAVGATLIRFASTAQTEQQARGWARELLGAALVIAIAFGIPIVALAPSLTDALGVPTDPVAFRVLIAGAVVSALFELPLMWMRLKDRARLYFVIMIIRAQVHFFFMFLALHAGYGVPGVMAANGLCSLAFAALLFGLQLRDTGIGISRAALYRILNYGLPIVAASLCLFVLGSANRLFLPGVVSTDAIGHFGLASRIAMIVWLLFYPFDLWWGPRRISTLSDAGGLKLGARMWGIGVFLLMFGAVGMALAGPALIHMALPSSYAPAVGMLAPMILVQVLHHTAYLTNVGSLSREHGFLVFAIDAAGAAVAIVGYFVLVPRMAINGVIVSLVLGSATRIALYTWAGRRFAPLPYPWLAVLLSGIAAFLLILSAPPSENYTWRLLYTLLAMPAFLVVAVVTRLITIPRGGSHAST